MKVDLSPEAVTRRLRRVEELRRLCVALRRAGREAGLAPPEGPRPAAAGDRGPDTEPQRHR